MVVKCMAAIVLEDWNNRPVEMIRSKGGVFAFPDFSDNLIKIDQGCWPPPEILQKLCKSEKLWAYPDEDQGVLIEKLGYYCDLQSVHSEDAMQWSYFGPLIYGSEDQRVKFACWLKAKLELGTQEPTRCSISLWRRLPHPDNGSPNGPELDLLICTDQFVMVVESKWRSGEARWQGIDGTSTQLQLRQRYLARFGRSLFGGMQLAVLYVILDESQRASGHSTLPFAVVNLLWRDLCGYREHPKSEEIKRYYDWKRNLIARRFGIPAPG